MRKRPITMTQVSQQPNKLVDGVTRKVSLDFVPMSALRSLVNKPRVDFVSDYPSHDYDERLYYARSVNLAHELHVEGKI